MNGLSKTILYQSSILVSELHSSRFVWHYKILEIYIKTFQFIFCVVGISKTAGTGMQECFWFSETETSLIVSLIVNGI